MHTASVTQASTGNLSMPRVRVYRVTHKPADSWFGETRVAFFYSSDGRPVGAGSASIVFPGFRAHNQRIVC